MLILKGLVGLHRTIHHQLLRHYWLGIDLAYCDVEWFALEMNRDRSVLFEIATSTLMAEKSYPSRRPGAVAVKSYPTFEEWWLRGRRRA